MIRPLSICLAFMVFACGGDDDSSPTPDAAPAVTKVFVVRHAETEGTGTDPMLSTAGQARSELLATKLADAHITAIYTSEYHRTHDTASATSTASGIAIDVRPVGNLSTAAYGEQLAKLVREAAAPQAVLIVGHSNTVPDTVKALADTTITPIAETEYNRLLTITIDDAGAHLEASTY